MTTLTRPARPPAAHATPLRRRTVPACSARRTSASSSAPAASWSPASGSATAASTSSARSSGLLTGLGQLTALVGTWFALIGVLLMARVPWIDHVVGSDRLRAWHRWTGFLPSGC